MNLFEHLRNILFTKKVTQITDDELTDFVLFLLNRWISMYSPEMCEYVNTILNNKYLFEQDKQEQFRYIFTVVPKLKYKKINYIKKTKKEKPVAVDLSVEDKKQLIAKAKNISLNELNNILVELENIYGK